MNDLPPPSCEAPCEPVCERPQYKAGLCRGHYARKVGQNALPLNEPLRRGGTRTGLRRTRLGRIHSGMVQRCLNSNNDRYHRYGGRGIQICDEWLDFLPFYEWALANGYSDDLTINRIDNDGDYRPSNCEWIPVQDQYDNRTVPGKKISDYDAEVVSVINSLGFSHGEIGEMFGVHKKTIARAIRRRKAA